MAPARHALRTMGRVSSRKQQRRASQVVKQRLAAERRRRMVIWTTVIVVCLLVVAGGVGITLYSLQQQHANDSAMPHGSTSSDLRVLVGDGPVTVDVYLDLQCPICKEFETTARSTMDAEVANHTITIAYHPVNILDESSQGTHYSTRAGAAAGCAADTGQLAAYLVALYAHQPAENTSGLTNDQIIGYAKAGGVTGSSFPGCVRSGKYESWVNKVTDQFTRKGFTGTPTVLVKGQMLQNPTAQSLTDAINAAR